MGVIVMARISPATRRAILAISEAMADARMFDLCDPGTNTAALAEDRIRWASIIEQALNQTGHLGPNTEMILSVIDADAVMVFP